jgi:hypothetical protein
MKPVDRRELNEGLVDHIERLAEVHNKLSSPRIGCDRPSEYEFKPITDAINRLAVEIKTDPMTTETVPS